MSKKEIAKRYTLFIIGLFFAALGVAFSKHAELGVSPISSVANVMSTKFDMLSLGNWLIIWNCVLIIGQIIVLRKDFKVIQLLQIPLSFLFGFFTDAGMIIVDKLPVDNYFLRLLWVVVGIVILAFGVTLAVIANVIMNSGEAFVKAIADVTGKKFGNIKIAFDVICVAMAVVLSLIMFDGTIVGTREGTIITALLTGVVVKFYTKFLSNPISNLLVDNQEIASDTE